ncbi:MAG: flagellar biosynthetic protein FliR [bacterium]|nr:flagellar biosynthetic protein FliR [bacterium]
METVLAKAPYFVIVYIRLGAFIAFVPFFDNRGFIMPIKVTFAFFISLLLFPTILLDTWNVPDNVLGFMWVVTGEILIGISIGFVLMVLLFVLQLAGRLLGFQMAFSMANVADPTFGNSGVLSVILVLIGTMTFLSIGGDHYLLYTLNKSFAMLPPGSFASTRLLLKLMSDFIMHAFEIGFKLASPAIILLLCIDVTLGLIGKTASKMQIFFVGLPLKIAVGLFSFILMLELVVSMWARDIHNFPVIFTSFFKSMRI